MRLCLLGGSFDPPHLGHLHLARAANALVGVDRVRLIPAHRPPHKMDRALAPEEHRLAMTKLLAQEEPWMEVDERELLRRGTSFTIDTVSEIRVELGLAKEDLFFLIGSDTLLELGSWHRFRELMSEITFITVPRKTLSNIGWSRRLKALFPAEVAELLCSNLLPIEPLPISSTEIRERISEGRSIQDLVPSSIAEYIERNGLYRLTQ